MELALAHFGMIAPVDAPLTKRQINGSYFYCSDCLEFLVSHIDDGALAAAYRRSSGLCAPHLATAAGIVHRRPIERQMVQLEQLESAIMDRLIAELTAIMRKSDYRFADEPPGPERDAWIRAIHKISGSPRL